MKKALVLLSMVAAFALAACEPPADGGAAPGGAPAAPAAPAAPGGTN
ncbi:MAG: hypothetical protein WCZ18_02810 [Ottowia sp.]|nr:hypothetical protein [Ottowia sp.]